MKLACLFACCTLMCAAQLRPEDNTVAISYSDILNSGTEGNIVNELAAAISGNTTYDIETDQLGVVQRLANPDETLKAMRDKVPPRA